MSAKKGRQAREGNVPRLVQIVTAAAYAFGRAEDDLVGVEALYGLDEEGRVWQWIVTDPEWEGSRDGWRRLSNLTCRYGKEPARKA